MRNSSVCDKPTNLDWTYNYCILYWNWCQSCSFYKYLWSNVYEISKSTHVWSNDVK